MKTIHLEFTGDTEFRAREIMADLRTAAETLFFPLKMCGFWERAQDLHLCPQEERQEPCPHKLGADDPGQEPYSRTLERERQAVLEVVFPHANSSVFLR